MQAVLPKLLAEGALQPQSQYQQPTMLQPGAYMPLQQPQPLQQLLPQHGMGGLWFQRGSCGRGAASTLLHAFARRRWRGRRVVGQAARARATRTT
jgi:hypothetical protein